MYKRVFYQPELLHYVPLHLEIFMRTLPFPNRAFIVYLRYI